MKVIISYISVEAIDCFHVFWSQFKVKHLEEKKNHIYYISIDLLSSVLYPFLFECLLALHILSEYCDSEGKSQEFTI